jgi:general secretion pathway protein N
MSIVGHNLTRPAIGALGLAAGLLFGAAMAPTPSFAAATPETNSLNFAAPAVDSDSAAPAAPSVAAPLPASPRPVRAGREVHGNPLWAIPLESLKATRERPILLPSRRPPAPAVVAAPPVPQPVRPAPPAEPARPRLALVGAVVGDSEGIAVFVDEMTKAIVRLRTGEDYSGWVLRSVKGREATLQKAQDTMLLALPAPTGAPGQPAGPNIAGTAPPGETAMPMTMPPSVGPPVSPGTVVTPAVSAPLPGGLVVQPFVPPPAPPSPPPSAPRPSPRNAPPPAVPPV